MTGCPYLVGDQRLVTYIAISYHYKMFLSFVMVVLRSDPVLT